MDERIAGGRCQRRAVRRLGSSDVASPLAAPDLPAIPRRGFRAEQCVGSRARRCQWRSIAADR